MANVNKQNTHTGRNHMSFFSYKLKPSVSAQHLSASALRTMKEATYHSPPQE